MKLFKYSAMATLVVLLAACTNVERSRTLGNPSVNGKTIAQQVCSACHGADGNSTSPEYPRLAGQQPEYLIAQIKGFNQHTRTDRLAQEVMAGMSRDLTEVQLSEMAVYFSRQKVKNDTAKRDASDTGKSIYQKGLPEAGVVPCMVCHGVNAEGNSIFPRLAGQHQPYLVKQLHVFRDTHGRPGTPMADVSKSITDADIQHLADYLSSL
jgi:cytochrome c553